ncbi:hypothetical protein T492DRAFT_1118606 [Pavlovales sp. CCMP2436]|nr:hypothetical protein T492DRAFT_1118606 [Pavlovales sp. CCMP2436]
MPTADAATVGSKRKYATEFARAIRTAAEFFDSNGLALVRGNLIQSTFVMQRVRVDGVSTSQWESYGGAGQLTLANAVYLMDDIQSYIERAPENASSTTTTIYENLVLFPNAPAEMDRVDARHKVTNGPLVHFIAHVLEYSPGEYVSLSSLCEYKTRFCKEHGYIPKQIRFGTAFETLVAAKGMTRYTRGQISQRVRANPNAVWIPSVDGAWPKSAFVNDCSTRIAAGGLRTTVV